MILTQLKNFWHKCKNFVESLVTNMMFKVFSIHLRTAWLNIWFPALSLNCSKIHPKLLLGCFGDRGKHKFFLKISIFVIIGVENSRVHKFLMHFVTKFLGYADEPCNQSTLAPRYTEKHSRHLFRNQWFRKYPSKYFGCIL